MLRFKYYKDKITLGFTTCKSYDRNNMKRCNNCQHFVKEFPTPDEIVCGKCSSTNHSTRNCNSFTSKYINCVRNKNDDHEHHTNSLSCRSMKNQQELLKKKKSSNLNWTITHQAHRLWNVSSMLNKTQSIMEHLLDRDPGIVFILMKHG